jgi:hypothetical protein
MEYYKEYEKDFFSVEQRDLPELEEIDEEENFNYCFLCLSQIKTKEYSSQIKNNKELILEFFKGLPISLPFSFLMLFILYFFIGIVLDSLDDFSVLIGFGLISFVIGLAILFMIFGPTTIYYRNRNKYIERLEKVKNYYTEFFNASEFEIKTIIEPIKCYRCQQPIKTNEQVCKTVDCHLYERGEKRKEIDMEQVPPIAEEGTEFLRELPKLKDIEKINLNYRKQEKKMKEEENDL